MRTFIRFGFLLAISGAVFAAGSSNIVKTSAGTTAKDLSTAVKALPTNLPAVGSRGPNSLDEVIISEGFETTPGGQLPPGWTQNSVDAGTDIQFFDGRPTEWQSMSRNAFPSHAGAYCAANAYNDDGTDNDDWLIMPQMTGLTAPISISYWVASLTADYPEDYEVRVSTTGTDPADFSHLIYTGSSVPAAWTNRTHDLSGFGGAPFYVAFHHTSPNMFLIRLDDVVLSGALAGSVGAITGTVVDNSAAPVERAVVSIPNSRFYTRTDAAGHFVLSLIPVGTYSVNYNYDYYTPGSNGNVVVTSPDTVNAGITLVVPPTTDHVYVSAQGNVHIADGDTAFKEIQVTDNLTIADVNVTINIDHTWDSDLTIWLDSPSGTRILLASRTGGELDNFENCTLDDEGTSSISTGVAPFTGTYIPSIALSGFNGESTLGTWQLVVFDVAEPDTGHIGNVTLNIKTLGTSAVDEPRSSLLPTSLTFDGNYPNPFNGRTEFRFETAQPGLVTLVLYNTLGQEVARVIDSRMDAGTHSLSYDANSLASGVYIARLAVNGGAALNRKIVLLK